jgi:ATP-dependent helicase/nuclease subunit A
MAAAAYRDELYREQPFVLGVAASEIRKEFPEDEQILVQGIIDAFFYEDGKVILVDYKTDRVARAEELVQRYQIQLDSYEEALSRVTGKEIGQKLIYSFHLDTEIVLS